MSKCELCSLCSLCSLCLNSAACAACRCLLCYRCINDRELGKSHAQTHEWLEQQDIEKMFAAAVGPVYARCCLGVYSEANPPRIVLNLEPGRVDLAKKFQKEFNGELLDGVPMHITY